MLHTWCTYLDRNDRKCERHCGEYLKNVDPDPGVEQRHVVLLERVLHQHDGARRTGAAPHNEQVGPEHGAEVAERAEAR